jgi:alpha-L-rhamnosidase
VGLLQPEDWQAQWIEPDIAANTKISEPAKMLRKAFEVKAAITSARAYITGLGLYEAEINGRRVGDEVLTPGWTSYDTRVQYQTYDITDQIQPGANVVGVTLGDGWYSGFLAWRDNRNTWGENARLLLQIEIKYVDGSKQLVVSDGSWKAATGPILLSDIYNGETYDARQERSGWSSSGFDDSNWAAVKVVTGRKDVLIAPQAPAVRRMAELKPVAVMTTPAGETVVDMGQNMVGWIRLKVKGPAGKTIVLRHAEVLDRFGNFYTENLRNAQQTIRYTLKGGGQEVYEPHFTFQGFRYVLVEGWPGVLKPDDLTGIVVYSDMSITGHFESSDAMLNQLQHNIQWGQKGNFVDVPTDCPQRDERLGWTGDAQVFAPTACFNMDAAGFFIKWLKDVAADQQPDGAIPHVIPNVLSHGKDTGSSAATGWADACVVIPWQVYLAYGDRRVLEEQFDSMTKWVGYMRKQAGDSYLWNTGPHFGDWLAFNTTRSDYPGATTDKDFIATAYFAYSTSLLQRIATILGYQTEARDYAQLLEKIKTAFNKEFVTASGRLSPNTQTAYSLALAFDLLPEALRPVATRRLADDVKAFGHITTGFLGTPLICHVLTRYGYNDLAYMLLNRKEYPSWLYPITMGATTIWERWDGIKPDSTFQSKGMNSFNHYAYGAIGEWMYRVITGIAIDPAHPGYKHFFLRPQPGGGLTQARASHRSLYGEIESAWQMDGSRLKVTFTIPPNSTATATLPQARLEGLTEMTSRKAVPKTAGISDAAQDGEHVTMTLGSGTYTFQYPYAN